MTAQFTHMAGDRTGALLSVLQPAGVATAGMVAAVDITLEGIKLVDGSGLKRFGLQKVNYIRGFVQPGFSLVQERKL